MPMEKRPLIHSNHWNQLRKTTMAIRGLMVFSVLLMLAGITWLCKSKHPLEGYCAHIKPIQPKEYLERHARLANALKQEGVEGLVMEGGASMKYYTDIDWELTERPFLVLLQLDSDTIRTTIITPHFEATRAQAKLRASPVKARLVSWLEHESPFDAVVPLISGRLMVEQEARLFIYQGLSERLETVMATPAIRMLRMIKSKAELAIMQCANQLTQRAIELVRPKVKVGMTELDIQQLMAQTLEKGGLSDTWVLALVDANAALPHGTPTLKTVKANSSVLIDTGGQLLGYQSDTTRTFFMSQLNNQTILDAWYLVREAQARVLEQVNRNTTCAQVDRLAREWIAKEGYAKYFTHRLGHGIGLVMHEDPYMHQGNPQSLVPGMTFSVEPGIYVTDEFGIRLEDIVVVQPNGQLALLTHGLADNPWTLVK